MKAQQLVFAAGGLLMVALPARAADPFKAFPSGYEQVFSRSVFSRTPPQVIKPGPTGAEAVSRTVRAPVLTGIVKDESGMGAEYRGLLEASNGDKFWVTVGQRVPLKVPGFQKPDEITVEDLTINSMDSRLSDGTLRKVLLGGTVAPDMVITHVIDAVTLPATEPRGVDPALDAMKARRVQQMGTDRP